MSSSPRVWLITGASSGFGRALCDVVLKNGEIVVAIARRAHLLDDLVNQYSSDRILVVKTDVTQPQEVADAFVHAKSVFGRVDIVFNNAGYADLGEIESVLDVDARALFETNFWGAVSVTREAVKFFRESNPPGDGGRLLQMTSMYGIVGANCLAFYSASKHALEGFTKSIVQELDPAWNIKVTLLEPGFFQTELISHIMKWTSPHPAYLTSPMPSAMRAGWDAFMPAGDTTKLADVFYRAAAIPDPPLHFPLGRDAVANTKKMVAELGDALARYESWSDDVEFTSVGQEVACESV
ncbi:NAD-P-binding protein [Trametes versicolor FP-101664 SS1]|uniref:NAD-P-binding protein n=1 Tax=Trametes versicolor (strain FP-101664) TaxID=717944 RepID=UPI00046230E5|nr:NAD-P-binding protein [Trametes versicolor FP-101664 SS1]EIW52318.1 NAD-P-binding protein [Trametes versicolor FP-101664 SS1]